jgi:hypothetical protein
VLGVEEVRPQQVFVAVGVVGVDRGDLDAAPDPRVVVVLGRLQRPSYCLKWPRTVEIIMCLTSKPTLEWLGSTL